MPPVGPKDQLYSADPVWRLSLAKIGQLRGALENPLRITKEVAAMVNSGQLTSLESLSRRLFKLIRVHLVRIIKDIWVVILVVSYPTRWSFSFILGPLNWSSSWQWQPSIAGCRLFQTLLWTQLADFAQFFCKMYLLYMWQSRKTCLVWFGGVLPS